MQTVRWAPSGAVTQVLEVTPRPASPSLAQPRPASPSLASSCRGEVAGLVLPSLVVARLRPVLALVLLSRTSPGVGITASQQADLRRLERGRNKQDTIQATK